MRRRRIGGEEWGGEIRVCHKRKGLEFESLRQTPTPRGREKGQTTVNGKGW